MLRLPESIARDIDALPVGATFLSAPVRGEAIQVGTAARLTAAQIEVRKTPSSFTVRRADGAALQAQIVRHRRGGAESRVSVFPEPVPALGIRRFRTVSGCWLWIITDGADARCRPDLLQFLSTVLAFGLAKQPRERTQKAPTRRAS